MSKKKWKVIKRYYLCYCGLCFKTREEFTEHIKDTKRWRNRHFAMDYNTLPSGFSIFLVRRN